MPLEGLSFEKTSATFGIIYATDPLRSFASVDLPSIFFRLSFKCIKFKGKNQKREFSGKIDFCSLLFYDSLLGPKLFLYGSVARHVELLQCILREWPGGGEDIT